MAIRVFLVSDYCLTGLGLERLFAAEANRFQLIVSAFSMTPATVAAIVAAAPEVLLLDIDSDPDRVLPFIAEVHAAVPTAKIVLLTQLSDLDLQDRAVMNGASGILDKKAPPDAMLTAMAKVHEGQLWLDHETTKRIFVQFSLANSDSTAVPATGRIASLTRREREIVSFFARNSGDSGKTLAGKLNISEKTLRNHLTAIYEKLGVSSSHALLGFALQNGLDKQITSPA